jgi:hypothetical protein
MTYPRPVIAAMAVMTGLKALLTAAAVTELIGTQITGVILAVIMAIDIAVAFYVQAQVVPLSRTIAYEDAQEMTRAGGASTVTTGRLVNTEATLEELQTEQTERGTPGG